MNLNLFRVLTAAEQEAQRALADREAWLAQCEALGASRAALLEWDAAAVAYAPTTLYRNDRVINEARRAVREALMRGAPMPADVATALRELWARDVAGMLP